MRGHACHRGGKELGFQGLEALPRQVRLRCEQEKILDARGTQHSGGCEPQLEVHVGAALNVGLTPQEIIEAFLHSAVYCGFPRALNATSVAKKAFAERGLLPLT